MTYKKPNQKLPNLPLLAEALGIEKATQVSLRHGSYEGAPHVVIAGGGAAGHLFPGLAVAAQLRREDPGVRITIAGSGKECERRHIERAGFSYLAVSCNEPPKSATEVWQFLSQHIGSLRAAKQFIRQQQVSLVVGVGGCASLPMGRAAVRCRVPLMLLEQNAYPGRANRLLARRAKVICLALAKAKLHLKTRGRVFVTGNPLREEFSQREDFDSVDATRGEQHELPELELGGRRLLVLGGSGGSRELNELIPRALHKVRWLIQDCQIVHQSGQADRLATEILYRKFQLNATVVPFVSDMPKMLRATDLAVCRAGGTTLAELAMAGVPAVLVPWSKASGDQQRRNAELYCKIGAAVMLDPTSLTGRMDDCLAELLVLPLTHAEVRWSMAAAMRKMARPDATQQVVLRLRELLTATQQSAAA